MTNVTRHCLAVLLSCGAAATAAAQTPATPVAPLSAPASLVLLSPATAAAEDVQGRWSPRPRIRDGDKWSLELRAKFQGDTAWLDPVVDPEDEGFVWRRRRLGIRGEVLNRVEFEVEREFGDDEEPWRDVWVNLRVHDLLELRGGKFKAPFGLDNSTSSSEHDYIFRSLGTRLLVPGREVGGMVYGAVSRRRFTYALGVFNAEADANATDGFFDDDQGGDNYDRTVSGRVTVQPLDAFGDLPRAIRNLEIGASAAQSTVPLGKNGLKGRSVFGHEFFDRVYVNGDRRTLGVDVAVVGGPASVKAEWIKSSDERLGQGVGDIDLSKVFGSSWYVQGSWLVTGEDKAENIVPKRPLLQGGFGAIEVMARYEKMLFGSSESSGQPASTSPRGENLARNQDSVYTLGVSWHLNRWLKVQGNAIHESFQDVARAPIPGTGTYWSYVTRLQLAF